MRPPARFALCAACLATEPEPDDTTGPEGAAIPTLPLVETLGPHEIDLLDLEEIVMWGLEGETETFVHGRNPHTGRTINGTFDSAERVRAFFSRWGLLRLVYA